VNETRAAATLTAPPGEPRRAVVITALGLTQILAWGSSYYLPAVLAKPIAADTGWPLSLVIGGLSLGLLAGGLVSPAVGRAIDRTGGRPVLAASSVLIAAGQALLALAHALPVYFAAWILMGLGMGAGLYDAAFATLGRIYGKEARSAITTLTLWGGFASTVCWPLSALLVEQLGWRSACLVYAGIQLLFSLPVHLFLMPRTPPRAPSLHAGETSGGTGRLTPREMRAFLILAAMVTVGGAIGALFSTHLLLILQGRGLELAAAVALGALVGPSQVGARVVEAAFGKRYHPIWTVTVAAVLVATGLSLLLFGFPIVAVALILYAAGNGIWSIGRGSLPLALYGPSRYAVLMGRLAMPGLLAQAVAPSVGGFLMERGGPIAATALLAGLAAMNVVLAAVLWAAYRSGNSSSATST
jgi:predicted MFS family arabinose efflux permease